MEHFKSSEVDWLTRYLEGTATEQEVEMLFAWLQQNSPESIAELDQILERKYNEAFTEKVHIKKDNSEIILFKLLSKIEDKKLEKELFRRKVTQQRRFWYSIAAAFIVIFGVGFYFSGFLQQKKGDEIDQATLKELQAPTNSKAVITLADGRLVNLDSLQSGKLAQLGNIQLVKLADGQIVYKSMDGSAITEPQFNTLSNPVGSRVVDIQLSDGSHVWLNAGSSVTYPVTFVGSERSVTLRGEAYFEIAKDPDKKFIVNANGAVTEVLGTHFNVSAYAENEAVSVTLLEGSVKVKKSGKDKGTIIKPGQQANIAASVKVVLADLDQVMAWKEGKFYFGSSMDIKEVMNQLARWYGFEVEYENGLQAEVGGSISRDVDVKNVLQLLEKTGSVRFKYNNSKIIVMSP